MAEKIAVIANGTVNDYVFHKNLLEEVDLIICADGGANIAKKLDVKPDYIIGDFDSIDSEVLDYYKSKSDIGIIHDNNQDKTDLELALSLAESMHPSKITIIGASGGRIDHTLANILSLNKVKPEIKASIVDEYCTLELFDKNIQIDGEKNDIISVIPFSDVYNLNYTGFKWNVKNLDTKAGWFGLSNKLEKNKADISFSKGRILVIRVRES